ncbi:MAG: DUF2207 domain-containing protein, partial [Nanoarchaeota archaeon]|nr:DUF2207 domain-containing protein [Nanoarchaeota archaeon]
IPTSNRSKELQTEIFDYGNNTRIKWFYSAENEKKTFTIKYTLKKAVTAYNDVAELNWKVWGSNWGVPLSELYGWIELPKKVQDSNDVYVWGHPKVNGQIGLIENNKVLFQVFLLRFLLLQELQEAEDLAEAAEGEEEAVEAEQANVSANRLGVF